MFRVPGFHEVVYKDRVLQAKGYRSGIFLNSNLEIEDNFFNTFIFLVQLRSRRRSIMRILCLSRYIVKQLEFEKYYLNFSVDYLKGSDYLCIAEFYKMKYLSCFDTFMTL